MPSELFTYHFDMTPTLGIAVLLLLLGRMIKEVVPVLKRFFIPSPVVGGILFSFVALFGHESGLFLFTFDEALKNLLMLAFFTSVGFTASLKMLVNGGIGVLIFLGCAIVLICFQNAIGIGLAKMFDLNPLLGLAVGSVPLSGGHGTSAAFGPVLEEYGLQAGLSVSVAAATFGLVAGSMIGGPIARRLKNSRNLTPSGNPPAQSNADMVEGKLTMAQKFIGENELFAGCAWLVMAMGIGTFINMYLKNIGIILPGYLIPMVVAAFMRNLCDFRNWKIPVHTINVQGTLCLQFFLAMALMTMRLWDLKALAIPLITILLVQMLFVGLFAYFVTFNMMGKDYDAAVIACGHCGFGLGATPNAMANMDTFTGANGPSPKAFFVVPLVGSLFIDFFNAFIITTFIHLVV